ncbi:outer membrane beta-barrel domain-containing protein [bacterium]|nr:outer membrane beta-barrel domain-containing protein [bacterium]
MKIRSFIALLVAALPIGLPQSAFASESAAGAQFSQFEIRVIRPKYFQKSVRLELGATLGAVMNSTYTYTFLPGLHAGLHVAEWLELFGEGALGLTSNKSDCVELGTKFAIEPKISEIQMLAGGGAAVTPIYGKYQLSSGDVIYFDWFLLGGAGVANMQKRFGGCKPLAPGEVLTPAIKYSPVQFSFGTGQRYFLNKFSALNWYLRDYFIAGKDGGMEQSVALSIGASYYF